MCTEHTNDSTSAIVRIGPYALMVPLLYNDNTLSLISVIVNIELLVPSSFSCFVNFTLNPVGYFDIIWIRVYHLSHYKLPLIKKIDHIFEPDDKDKDKAKAKDKV